MWHMCELVCIHECVRVYIDLTFMNLVHPVVCIHTYMYTHEHSGD